MKPAVIVGKEMENSNQLLPPYLNAEIYRTNTAGTDTVSHLDYIRIHQDGSALIGVSDLTGRYWNGGASVFKNVEEAQRDYKKAKKCISLSSGTNDGCFIDSSLKVILCEDNGSVGIWSATPDDAWRLWENDVSASEHDEAALAVDCLDPGQEYVTAGADGNIKVWDINDMICIRNYAGAHNMAIYSIATRPMSKTSFASASADNYVTLWDEGVRKPVIDLVKNDCGVRCLQWVDENRIVYGDEAGVLRLVDVRNIENIQKLTGFPAAVHKLALNSKSDQVAVCCDNKIVSVCTLDDENCKTIYHDRHNHSNYVRGLAWDVKDNDTLHTVGWDGEIKTHQVSS